MTIKPSMNDLKFQYFRRVAGLSGGIQDMKYSFFRQRLGL